MQNVLSNCFADHKCSFMTNDNLNIVGETHYINEYENIHGHSR